MSGETLIRIIEDVILEDGCTHAWEFVCEGSLPYYHCHKHNTDVELDAPCPRSEFWARKGETVSVPPKVARRLVESELAEYPTHSPEPDQGVQATVDRVNAMLEAEGLPTTSLEAMGVLNVTGHGDHYGTGTDPYGRPRRPARPSDRRLANDLGLDPADIAAMRKAANGS